MQSRNKREGFYFGRGYDLVLDEDGFGYFTKQARHKRIKRFKISLKGFFKDFKRVWSN